MAFSLSEKENRHETNVAMSTYLIHMLNLAKESDGQMKDRVRSSMITVFLPLRR